MTKALIVDDNIDHAEMLAAILRSEKYDVAILNDARNIVEDVKNISPDMILIDVKMPHVDGYEATKLLRSDLKTKNIPIIIQSAAENLRKGYLDALAAGADDYIAVPVSRDELIARAETCIKRKTYIRNVQEQLLLDEARLEAFFKISQKVFSSERELVDFVVDDCVRLTSSKVGYCHFFNEDEKTINLYCWSKNVYKECSADEDQHYPVDRAGIWADPVRTGHPAVHNDYQHAHGKKGYPQGHFPVIRHMSVPVIDGKKVVAIIGVGNKEADYNEADLKQMQSYVQGAWTLLKQRRYEDQLKDASERFRAVTETAKDAIMMLDDRGRIIIWNKAAETMFGYSEKEALGKDCHELIAPKRYLEVYRTKARFFSESGRGDAVGHTVELEGLRRDGSEFPVELSISAVRLNGKWHAVGIVRDITERKLAGESMRREQALSNAIIDSILGTFYMIDERGKYVRWNPYQRDEIVGKPDNEMHKVSAIDTIHPDDRKIVAEKIANVIVHGMEESIEGRVLLKGGPDYVWLLMTGRQMMVEGKPYLVGTGVDITDRKNAEEALRVSEKYLSKIIDAVADPIFVKDSQYRWVLINSSFCEFMGRKLEDLKGKSDYDFFPKTEADVFRENDQKVFDSGEENVNEELFTDGRGVRRTIVTKIVQAMHI